MQPIELSTALADVQAAKRRLSEAKAHKRVADLDHERAQLELHGATSKLVEVRNRLNKYLGEDERG